MEAVESDMPRMTIESSREYVQKVEAATMLKILKGTVARWLQAATPASH